MLEQRYHYVYQITNLVTARKYIGKRSSLDSPAVDLGRKYFSSSSDREFILDQKTNPSNYKYEVLMEFNTAADAVTHEVKLHNLYDVGRNPEFYNKVKQTDTSFNASGKITVRDADGNTSQVDTTDPRYTSGELVSVSKGKVITRDNSGNNFLVDKNDPRYIGGELISIKTGKAVVKDRYGNKFHIQTNDPRYLSGEFVGATKGRPMDNHTRTRVSETQTGSGNSQYGTRWIHNPTLMTCSKIKKDAPIPGGWTLGRKMKFG